jgi:myotubularin-related protein 5/13
LQKAALYVFGDKSQIKGVKLESHSKADFIPVEYPEPRRLRASFKKLMRACAPSSIPQPNSEQTFLKLVEQSEWLQLLQAVMQLAGAVTDLIDLEGSSVMLCLEDGWDLTCQVSSLAQLCLDPHYRTMEGFRVLIEKEWLAYGHRFNHRSNFSNTGQDGGFTPLFLQFLDLVHQLHTQFPMAFEFNQYYLKFLAYHHVSCRFRTFLLDSEFERKEFGFTAQEDKSGSLAKSQKGADLPSSDEESHGSAPNVTLPGSHLGVSIFDYVERQAGKSPIFYNLLYCPDLQHQVLRPFSHMSDLVVWDYYIKEELRHGPSYDVELTHMDLAMEEETAIDNNDMASLNRLGQHTVTTGYDNMTRQHMDSVSFLLQELNRLEQELGHLPRRWTYHWGKVEAPPAHPPPPPPHQANNTPSCQVTTPSMYARQHGRSVHKRSTMELLLRGKSAGFTGTSEAGGGGASYTHPHRFEKYNYTTPTYCDLCHSVLWGIVRTGFKCQDCGLNCHEKCRENVRKACTKYRTVQSSQSTTDNLDQVASNNRDNFSFPTRDSARDEHSNIIYQGYLYKRGALLKAWKPRWFVLDTIKHQLRYYDTREDFHCKGAIDLSEVRGVGEGSSAPGAPKKADDHCFIDLHTTRRTYSLCAETRQQALDWMEKIQNCL